jgi:prepilin peptidase CpaA
MYPLTANNFVLKLTISDAVIFFVSGLAVFFDLWIRKIPNWVILIGLLCGLTVNGIQGSSYLIASILGFVAGIIVLVFPFALGWLGAGDVKYFGVVGALLGVSWLPRVFFYSALVAGSIAVGYMVTGFTRCLRFKELWLDLETMIVTGGQVLPNRVSARTSEHGVSVPWGVAFAAGTILAYYFDPTGKWASF